MLPNLTSIRFFFAFLVILFHLPEFSSKHGIPNYNSLPVFQKGAEAVYAFFSLSGFLIIRQLHQEKLVTGTISLKKFFQRRMLRIFPLYFIILCFGLLYYHLILPAFGYPFENNYNLVEGILLCLFFMPNVFAISYQPGGIIGVLWSIGIEEQFYLLIAPLLFVIPQKHIFKVLLFFTILYYILFFRDSFYILRKFEMYFFYFSSAGIIAILFTRNASFFRNEIIRNSLLLVLISYFTTNLFKSNLTDEVYHLFSLIIFAASIGFLAANPLRILNNPFLTYLGKISFGIYMFHSIVIQLVGFVFLKSILNYDIPYYAIIVFYNIIVITLTVLISHLSYKYYESYFIKLKKH
jgi:peptidoglycan/LPS O-acetylase OafA/YrhL